MTALQKTLIITTVAALAGAGLYQARQAMQLRDHIQSLQQQMPPLAQQIQPLQASLADATNQLASLLAENRRLKSNPQVRELLKLRGEVTMLQGRPSHSSEAELNESSVKALIAKRDKLRQFIADHPERSLPELQFLTEQQWMHTALDAQFDTDTQINSFMSSLENNAVNGFMQQMQAAMSQYAKNNNGQLPADLSQVQAYFETPLDQAILDAWRFETHSQDANVPEGGWSVSCLRPEKGYYMKVDAHGHLISAVY